MPQKCPPNSSWDIGFPTTTDAYFHRRGIPFPNSDLGYKSHILGRTSLCQKCLLLPSLRSDRVSVAGSILLQPEAGGKRKGREAIQFVWLSILAIIAAIRCTFATVVSNFIHLGLVLDKTVSPCTFMAGPIRKTKGVQIKIT